MHLPTQQTALLWSGGKDSILALHHLQTGRPDLAVTVCVDTQRLTDGHCGQLLTRTFGDSLPAGVDPCGERGEYHSFTFDGPLFRHPVAYTLGQVHHHEPFAFQELFPGSVTPSHPELDAASA